MAKVKCSKCGELKFVNPKALEARLKKFGSIEEIEKNWECKKCNPKEKKEKGEHQTYFKKSKVIQDKLSSK